MDFEEYKKKIIELDKSNLFKNLIENYDPKIIIRDLIDIKVEYKIYLIANSKELDLFANKVLNRILYFTTNFPDKYNEKELIEKFKNNFDFLYNELKNISNNNDFNVSFNSLFFDFKNNEECLDDILDSFKER